MKKIKLHYDEKEMQEMMETACNPIDARLIVEGLVHLPFASLREVAEVVKTISKGKKI